MNPASELIPNSFQMPNMIVDRLLPHLSGPEVKVLALVCRKTFGWHKREDLISLTQFETQAGVSRSSANTALRFFEEVGLLTKASKGPRQMNAWGLNLNVNPDAVLERLMSRENPSTNVALQVVRSTNQFAHSTSAIGAPVQPENQICTARRTRSSTTGEHTETKETHKTNVEREGKWDSSVEEAWRFYCQTMERGPQYELTRQRRQMGIDGLTKAARYANRAGSAEPEENALALLKLAIERMPADKWHNGEESGTKYLGWEQLFTSKRYPGNKLVEYWLNEDNAAKWGAA